MNEHEWKEWKAQPQTRAFFNYLNECREEIKEDWAEGAFNGESATDFAFEQLKAREQASALKEIIEITFEDLESDGEYIEGTPS